MLIRKNHWSEEEKGFSSEIKQIQGLKSVKPNQDWVLLGRARLMMKMEMERKNDMIDKDLFAFKELLSYLQGTPHRAFHFAYTLIIIFGLLVSGGGLTAWAAMKSLPGSPLYQVKIALEKARLMTATSEESRMTLQGDMATRRVEELKALVDLPASDAGKNAQVEEAVTHVQQQLISMKDQLPKVANQAGDGQRAVYAAKVVGEKTEQIEKTLAQVKNSLSQDTKDNVSEKLAEAAETADKTSTKALEYRVYGYQISSDSDKEQTAAKLQERIQKLEEKIADLEKTISISDKFPIKPGALSAKSQWDAVKKLLNDASTKLIEAKKKVNDGDISGAWDILKGVSDVIGGAEKIVAGLTQPDSNDSQTDQNATSSAIQIPAKTN